MNNVYEMITQLVLIPTVFLLAGWVIKVIWEGKRTRLKSELHHKLMDQFSNGQELGEVLQSESGNNFLDSLQIKGEGPLEGLVTKEKLLTAISRGIILASLGAAVIIVGMLFEQETRYTLASGLVICMLSIGFLVSSAVSFVLSKKWGLIEKE